MSETTYRRILKWGNPDHDEKLKDHVVHALKQDFDLSEADLNGAHLSGEMPVKLRKKSRLSAANVKSLKSIVGVANVDVSDDARASHSHGKFYGEIMRMRMGKIDNPPDAVVSPRDESDVNRILKLCRQKKIAVVPFGGNSSVTRALEAHKGGIALALTRHMNEVVHLSEINQSVTVQPGMYGPDLEKYLNERGYTCGHFPQSFEFSTVGGWAAARGAGQASTGYGTMADMVLSMRVATPNGVLETSDYAAASIGPDLDQLIVGSEGIFGVITEITMKVRPFRPENSELASYMFKDFESAVNAMREIMQGEFGKPHFFRVQDPEETSISFRMAGMEGGLADKFLNLTGYKDMQRSLMHVIVEGDKDYTDFVARKIKKVARKYGAFSTGRSPVEKWLEQRYSSAYLRDPMMDMGIMIDTVETSVTWENLHGLWSNTRAYIKSRENTNCLVHISHCYENGAMLYFIFMSPMNKGNELKDFEQFHKGLIDTIHKHKGSLSHHHGIGRLAAPWMKGEVGATGLGILQAVKDYTDPTGIMNPGGSMLGLKK